MFWEETKEKKTNPVSQFYDWKSDKENNTGTFKWWNKELEQEVSVKPKEFILLLQTSCVKWWDEKSGSGIYSNEVISTKDEDLIVRAFKEDSPIYQGKYDKEAIANIGGKFNKGIIVSEWDLMIEYYLKGWALFVWNEDIASIDTNNYKVKLDKIEERKKWAVTFYVPRWVKGSKITEKEREVAMMQVWLLNEYNSNE